MRFVCAHSVSERKNVSSNELRKHFSECYYGERGNKIPQQMDSNKIFERFLLDMLLFFCFSYPPNIFILGMFLNLFSLDLTI